MPVSSVLLPNYNYPTTTTHNYIQMTQTMQMMQMAKGDFQVL